MWYVKEYLHLEYLNRGKQLFSTSPPKIYITHQPHLKFKTMWDFMECSGTTDTQYFFLKTRRLQENASHWVGFLLLDLSWVVKERIIYTCSLFLWTESEHTHIIENNRLTWYVCCHLASKNSPFMKQCKCLYVGCMEWMGHLRNLLLTSKRGCLDLVTLECSIWNLGESYWGWFYEANTRYKLNARLVFF